MSLRKDEILDRLAMRGNVAQFVAFRPDGGTGRPAIVGGASSPVSKARTGIVGVSSRSKSAKKSAHT